MMKVKIIKYRKEWERLMERINKCLLSMTLMYLTELWMIQNGN